MSSKTHHSSYSYWIQSYLFYTKPPTMMRDAPVGTQSSEIESSSSLPTAQQLPQLPVRRTVLTTLMFLLFLVFSAGVFMGQARAQGLSLGGDGTAPAEPKKETLDLGPAPATQSSGSGNAATQGQVGGAAPPNLADLVRTKHGDWDVACEKSGSPCVMAQIGNDNKGTPILEMVLRVLPDPQEVQGQKVIAVTDIITPLGVVLTSGLTVQIDSEQEQRAPFQICTEQGCLVREPLTEEAVTRFKKGANARLTVVAAQQGPVSATISLRGFTKAYNSL